MTTITAAAPRLAAWLGWLALTIVLIAISYQWFDRPISFFSYSELQRPRAFVWMTRIPEWARVVAVVAVVVLGVYSLTGRMLAKPFAVIFLASLSLFASRPIKDQLQLVFGRTWPETYVQDNPSLIRDGVFGFNPFKGGAGFEAFPSGHTTATCAVLAVLWLCWPKFRLLYVLVFAAVAIGLLGANYHFLSDIIGGAFVGLSVGWIAVRLWEATDARSVLPGVPANPEVSAAPQVSGETAEARETMTADKSLLPT